MLAVLTITAEYDTGLIATTLAATPQRRTVFVAKTVTVTTVVVVPTSLVSVAGALVGGRILLPGNGFAADSGVPRHCPSVTNPPCARPWAPCSTRVERYALISAGLAVRATRHLDALPIGPCTGLAVLAVYAGAALAIGAALFITRDVHHPRRPKRTPDPPYHRPSAHGRVAAIITI